VSGTVCLNMSLPHLLWLSSDPVSRHICLTYHIPTPCDCTAPAQWRSLLSDTIIVLVTYLITYRLDFYQFKTRCWSYTLTQDNSLPASTCCGTQSVYAYNFGHYKQNCIRSPRRKFSNAPGCCSSRNKTTAVPSLKFWLDPQQYWCSFFSVYFQSFAEKKTVCV